MSATSKVSFTYSPRACHTHLPLMGPCTVLMGPIYHLYPYASRWERRDSTTEIDTFDSMLEIIRDNHWQSTRETPTTHSLLQPRVRRDSTATATQDFRPPKTMARTTISRFQRKNHIQESGIAPRIGRCRTQARPLRKPGLSLEIEMAAAPSPCTARLRRTCVHRSSWKVV